MTNNIIDFSKKKLEKERKEYELNLDTEIITTRREIEELATDIVMEFAELWEIDQLIAEKIYEKINQISYNHLCNVLMYSDLVKNHLLQYSLLSLDT